jgi:hypothetical protein
MHDVVDRVSVEMARRVAARVRADPSLIKVAQGNLECWKKRHQDSPALLRCDIEWEDILKRSVEEICSVLCAETDEGQRLRQNAPFPGILSAEEVRLIKREFRHSETART